MKVAFHTLSWTNADMRLIEWHRKVTSNFGINIEYSIADIRHGVWMGNVIAASTADIISFFDSDCVPLSASSVQEAIRYVSEHDSFFGIAQASNHIHPRSHIYAGPAFFFIAKSCYERLGKPSFVETARSDVAEELAYIAEENNFVYRTIYPTHYELVPSGGAWRLGNYGVFGIGTVYDKLAYHLFQGRFSAHTDLFAMRCDEILRGTFSTVGMRDAKALTDKLEETFPAGSK